MRPRVRRLAGTILGIALTVALIACSAFLARQLGLDDGACGGLGVPIDWQVQPVPGADPAAIRRDIGKAAPVAAVRRCVLRRHGRFSGHAPAAPCRPRGRARSSPSGRITATFPKEIRLLSGSLDGALMAQQTAANLHVGPGDKVTIKRIGLTPATVTVAGVVDLPDADSLFQASGCRAGRPAGAARQCGDPAARAVAPALRSAGRSAARQHAAAVSRSAGPRDAAVAADRCLPQVTAAARNLEARLAGQALVANNLGARLDAVRGDSLYATVLFLFLGLPGVAIAAAVTAASRRAAAIGAAPIRRCCASAARPRGGSCRLARASRRWRRWCGRLAGLALAAFGRAAGLLAADGALHGGCGLPQASACLAVCCCPPSARCAATRDGPGGASVARGAPSGSVWLDLMLLAAAGLLFWQRPAPATRSSWRPRACPRRRSTTRPSSRPALFWIGLGLLLRSASSGSGAGAAAVTGR